MSKDIFFDSDCLSAFLAVGAIGIPVILYEKKIIIPKQVYDELVASHEEGYKEQIDSYISRKMMIVVDIQSNDQKAAELYFKLNMHPDEGFMPIGRGEAAAIALSVTRHGILASNNLKDVRPYVDRYGIDHITTGMIIHEAVKNEVITKEEAETYWAEMVKHHRWLGADTYKEYVDKKLYVLK